MRHCEAMLIQGETELLERRLQHDSSISVFVAKVSHLMRMVVRLLNGEDPVPRQPSPSLTLSDDDQRRESRGYISVEEELDQVLQRETELARLEKENEELRRLVAISTQQPEPPATHPDLDTKVETSPVEPVAPGPQQPSDGPSRAELVMAARVAAALSTPLRPPRPQLSQ